MIVTPLKEFTRKSEAEYIHQVLMHYEFNKTQAAKALKIDRKTLHNKLPKKAYKRA